MTMKRLMIMAAMMTALACGDDAGGDDGSDDSDDSDDTEDDSDDDDAQDASVKADASKSDAATGNECTLLSYTSFGKPFEERYCASCHAASVEGDDRNDAPEGAVFDTLKQMQDAKARLKVFVVTGKTMPPPDSDGDMPTDAERTQFGKFLDCGPK
jgi:uncharacterized membrane protein